LKLSKARKIRLIGPSALLIPFFQSAYVCPYTIPWVVCSECEVYYCLFNPRNSPLRDYLAIGIFASGLGFGRAFCSWLCPYGVLQENLMMITKRTGFPFLNERIRMIRFIVFIVTLLLVWLLVFPILVSRQMVPDYLMDILAPFYMLTFPIIAVLTQNFVIIWVIRMLAVFGFLILAIYVGRAWCSICPLGYLLGFFNRISMLKLEGNKDILKKNPAISKTCKSVCQAKINPTKDTDKVECIRCLNCYYTCSAKSIQKREVLSYGAKVKKV
jgi:polyferredoxin